MAWDETAFKANLVAQCRAKGWYARRHEDRYAIGLLDLAIKIPGHPHLLAEGKIIRHQAFAPTERQWVEGERYRRAGGTAVLIGWDLKRVMYIHEWAKEASKEGSFTESGRDYATILEHWLEQRK